VVRKPEGKLQVGNPVSGRIILKLLLERYSGAIVTSLDLT
jgi:hypothetical protein